MKEPLAAPPLAWCLWHDFPHARHALFVVFERPQEWLHRRILLDLPIPA
jgi:hypothetical protein